MKTLRIAISQFPISNEIKKNKSYILKHINIAAKNKSNVIHFPETALSGYEFNPVNFDWILLRNCFNSIIDHAKNRNISVVIGSIKKQRNTKKPFNVVYCISENGKLLGSYSKTNLYKDENNRFNSIKNLFVCEINSIKCGFLICYDSCFPELFKQYQEKNVKILFLSYYNANNKKGKNSLDDLMKAQLRTRAADYNMYISGSNSSAKYSRMPSAIVSPDGKLTCLKRHKPGVLIYDYPEKNLGWTYNNQNYYT